MGSHLPAARQELRTIWRSGEVAREAESSRSVAERAQAWEKSPNPVTEADIACSDLIKKRLRGAAVMAGCQEARIPQLTALRRACSSSIRSMAQPSSKARMVSAPPSPSSRMASRSPAPSTIELRRAVTLARAMDASSMTAVRRRLRQSFSMIGQPDVGRTSRLWPT